MAKYCVNPDCNNAKTGKEFKDGFKNCDNPKCKQKLSTEKLQVAQETFDQRFLKVFDMVSRQLDKKNNSHHATYVIPMLNYLQTCHEWFKQDFCREFYDVDKRALRDSNVNKLVKPENRASDKGTNCVDQALAELRTEFATPKELPKGEKFDFELPYILKDKWTFLNNDDPRPFGTDIKSLCQTLSEKKVTNRYYLINAKQSESAPIGHMIAIVVDQKGTPWLLDQQALSSKYGSWAYMGWVLEPAADLPPRKSGPTLNLKTGDVTT